MSIFRVDKSMCGVAPGPWNHGPANDRRRLPATNRRRLAWFLAAAVALTLAHAPGSAQEQVLVQAGTPASYLANTSDPGIGMGWVNSGFDDSAWSVGTYGFFDLIIHVPWPESLLFG